ncbi:MAG: hypothetical protein QOJ70_2757 [Acidobacteriota bacterium]|jgi:hypothetical protein|nr:hypothetical protein [Acidobacteriota bacterium]MDT7808944.1 hypothetical protein [Acidobacteriota bacterium]
MSKKKETARKDDERQVRGKPGPPSQARSEKKRRREDKGSGASRGVPRVGKHDSTGGDNSSSSGNGLH